MNNFSDRINYLKKIVDRRIFKSVNKAEPSIFFTPIRYLLEGGEKRIRSIFLILSAEAVGGSTELSLNAAVAVELLHNCTLIHDDIMDNSQIRRGRPTVHYRWDEATAILAGDGLLAMV